MGNNEFESVAKNAVATYYRSKFGYIVPEKDIFLVWSCKTLQNNKAIVAAKTPDFRLFEVTHNGDGKEIYIDGYVKEDSLTYKDEYFNDNID